MAAFSFLVRRCRRTWKMRFSTWTVHASALIFSCSTWVHNGRERPFHHFSFRPTLHVEVAPFNLDSSGFSMVFSSSTVAHCQMSHFSDSLAVFSGSAVSSMNMRFRPRIGIFVLLQVSGFVSCLALTNVLHELSFPSLQTHVEGAPFNLFNLDGAGVSMVFSSLTMACCLGSSIALPFLCLTLHMGGAPFNLDLQVSAWSPLQL